MKMKAVKNMKGFMCQSPGASAASCMASEPLSVIVPRRSLDRNLSDHSRLINNAKYIQLGEPRKYGSTTTSIQRSTAAVPSLVAVKDDQEKQSSKAASSPAVKDQVVVMRVSLHCQGCAGKVKKHLSKMEGVTSFSIDLESKRVTVIGSVSPKGVLESISKVKRAEFWPC